MIIRDALYEKYRRLADSVNSHELVRTSKLKAIKLHYHEIVELIGNGYLEKIRHGYYRLIKASEDEPSEAQTIGALYPDGVVCMHTALFYFGYSERTPLAWDIAIDRNTSKARFHIDYPFVKPYFMSASHLAYGVIEADYDGCKLKIFDRDRLVCECIRNENKIDKETYNAAIRAYVNDPKKSISNLIEHARKRGIQNKVKDRIGVWL